MALFSSGDLLTLLSQRGEISFGRLALEEAPLAPGSKATREALSDPVRRRPPQAREVRAFQPRAPYVLDKDTFFQCLRIGKVAGDIVRRLVSGAITKRWRHSNRPLPHSNTPLSKRGGASACLTSSRASQTLTPIHATVMSIDGIGRMIQYRGGQCGRPQRCQWGSTVSTLNAEPKEHPGTLRTFFSVKEGWAWPAPFSPGQQHVGPVGLTASIVKPATQSSLRVATCFG